MKVTAFFHGLLLKNQIILRCTDEKDMKAVWKMFASKQAREERSGKEILLRVELDAEFQKRSFKQLNAVWKLVEVIFYSENNRLPTDEEKYFLYEYLLELYADKAVNPYNDTLIPVRISVANTMQAANFIDGLLYHLATECQLTQDLQATVRSVLYDWEIWRGNQESDINDTRTIEEMRKRVVYSEASGNTPADFHHILSRGAYPQYEDCAWNILALTRDEHTFFHAHGWADFLDKYPHLRGRVQKAFQKGKNGSIPNDFDEAGIFDAASLASIAMG